MSGVQVASLPSSSGILPVQVSSRPPGLPPLHPFEAGDDLIHLLRDELHLPLRGRVGNGHVEPPLMSRSESPP